jgi:acyl-CoA reductase-like NAD-dependent aldehyde dehydrogenase
MTRETGKPIKMSRNELNGLLPRIDFFLGMVEPVATNRAGVRRSRHARADPARRRWAWSPTSRPGTTPGSWAATSSSRRCSRATRCSTSPPSTPRRPAWRCAPAARSRRAAGRHGVPGRRRPVGTALLEQKIDGVFFTGSHATGRRISQAMGRRFVKLQLELGGKDPTYVCDDVDPKSAAESLADGAMYNTGQSCCSVERIYVHEKVHDAFVTAFVDTVKGMRRATPPATTPTSAPSRARRSWTCWTRRSPTPRPRARSCWPAASAAPAPATGSRPPSSATSTTAWS